MLEVVKFPGGIYTIDVSTHRAAGDRAYFIISFFQFMNHTDVSEPSGTAAAEDQGNRFILFCTHQYISCSRDTCILYQM